MPAAIDDEYLKPVIAEKPAKKYPIYLTPLQMGFFWAMIEMLPNKDNYPLSRRGITEISDQLLKYHDVWKANNQ